MTKVIPFHCKVLQVGKYRVSSKLSVVNGAHLTYFGLNEELIIEPRTNIRLEFSPRAAVSAGFGMHSKIESLEYYFGNTPLGNGNFSGFE